MLLHQYDTMDMPPKKEPLTKMVDDGGVARELMVENLGKRGAPPASPFQCGSAFS